MVTQMADSDGLNQERPVHVEERFQRYEADAYMCIDSFKSH